MRIGVDFHAAEREGTGNCTYIRNIIEKMVQIDGRNEYYLYITNHKYEYYKRFHGLKNVKLVQIQNGSPVIRMLSLGFTTFRDKIDVLHGTYYGPPFFRGKLILTVHDLSYLHIPDSFSRFERIKNILLIPLYSKRAEKILTVSEYSKMDIVNQYGISGEKIMVGYNGVDSMFKPVRDIERYGKIKEKYGISHPYILFVGRLNKRKNLVTLVGAFNSLKESKGIPHQLVIAGSKDFMPEAEERAIMESRHSKDIIFTGFFHADDLPCLYSYADVFVYPSIYEGFGLPCAEAMACGCPVISSLVTSIPEVVGDAGILIDPLDVDALFHAVYNVVSDKSLRDNLVEKGFEQARKFNWGVTAEKIVDLIENLQ